MKKIATRLDRFTAQLVCVLLLSALVACGAAAQQRRISMPAPAGNVYPLQEGFVDVNGMLIYYKPFGRGAPLMIVHGGPGESHDYFLPYLLPLARTNRS